MSSLTILGDTSGSVVLQAPAVSGSTTLTLPAATGTVMVSGNIPAFSAYIGSVPTITTSTWTKVQFNTESFDTANCFDSTTNYRFTPNVAGYYQISSLVRVDSGSSWSACAVYKNGSFYRYGLNANATPNDTFVTLSTLMYLNGSTDYIEMYVYQSSGANRTLSTGISASEFSAFLARTA